MPLSFPFLCLNLQKTKVNIPHSWKKVGRCGSNGDVRGQQTESTPTSTWQMSNGSGLLDSCCNIDIVMISKE